MKVIVKIKDEKTWEETEVYSVLFEADKEEVYEILQPIADFHRKEVRWEFESIGQGHYIQPNPRLMTMLLIPTKRQIRKYAKGERRNG